MWHTVLSIAFLLRLLHQTLGILCRPVCHFYPHHSASTLPRAGQWVFVGWMTNVRNGTSVVSPPRCNTTWCCTSRCSCVSSPCGTGSWRGTGGAGSVWMSLPVSTVQVRGGGVKTGGPAASCCQAFRWKKICLKPKQQLCLFQHFSKTDSNWKLIFSDWYLSSNVLEFRKLI